MCVHTWVCVCVWRGVLRSLDITDTQQIVLVRATIFSTNFICTFFIPLLPKLKVKKLFSYVTLIINNCVINDKQCDKALKVCPPLKATPSFLADRDVECEGSIT